MATDNNDMRKLLGKMRNLNNPNKVNEYTAMGNNAGNKKEMTMRDMLAITRKKILVEGDMSKEIVTPIDKKQEEQKMENYFNNSVNITFDDLIFYGTAAVWFGGVINNVLKWVFTVGNDENLNKIDIELLENPMEKSDDTNSVSSMESIEEITEKLKAYYNNEFKPYWIHERLQK